MSTILTSVNQPIKCPHCGHDCRAQDTKCSQCGEALTAPAPAAASTVDVNQVTLPLEHQDAALFEPHANIILRFSLTGERVALPLKKSVILGRPPAPGSEDAFDLTPYDAYQKGVSRRHCMLQRRGTHLIVIDLGSSNGTYLNDRQILAYQHHIVTHGDQLVLGALHLTISFSTRESL